LFEAGDNVLLITTGEKHPHLFNYDEHLP
jgi:hypothetical protein